MRVLAIVPAHNEEGSIVSTVNGLKSKGIDYLVINDGSTDDTERICLENGFNILTLPVNLGLAGGFQTGMKFAYAHNYDCAIQFDADGQHLPGYVAPMVEWMEESGSDIVIGSRFLNEGKPFSARMVGSALISGLIRLTTGKKINDPTSGMRLYNRRTIEILAHGTDLSPEPDTISLLLRKGLSVSEFQVSMEERVSGESYLNFGRSLSYMARTCISILFVQWFR